MTNGDLTTETVSTEINKLTYPGIQGNPVTVTVQDGVMSVDAFFNDVVWVAQLPLIAAPVMLQIAEDMVVLAVRQGLLPPEYLTLVPGATESGDSGDSGAAESGLLDSGLTDSGSGDSPGDDSGSDASAPESVSDSGEADS